ncbi:MAG: aminotransferase class I/II-fold pyridoxal phosphate-dependent enzyme [Sporolactobacillus sp.]
MTDVPEEKFDTLKIHAGYDPKEHHYASSVPIYQTVAFGFGDSERADRLVNAREKGFSYSRLGNPTTAVLEKRIAKLDGASEAVAVGSGMAAVSYTILNLAEGGGRILTSSNIYGSSFDEFRTLFPKYGITFDFMDDINDLKHVEASIREDTKAIFVESVTNPATMITDVAALAQLAHQNGIPLVVDNTFPTPYLFNPIRYGADIVVYSSTKGISGHGEVISGLIVDAGNFNFGNGKFKQFEEKEFILGNEETHLERSFAEAFGKGAFAARIRMKYLRLLGAVLSPFESYLVLLGIETLSERLTKQVASAQKIAEYLVQNPHVKAVQYSGLADHPQHELVKKYFPRGVGAIFSFTFDGTEKQTRKVLDSVRVFSYLPNVGDARSLIVNPGRTTHREIPLADRERNGLSNNLIRLSIGLEDVNDLIDDLDQAIRKAVE